MVRSVGKGANNSSASAFKVLFLRIQAIYELTCASVVMLLQATRFGARNPLKMDESKRESGRNDTTYQTSVLDYTFPPISPHVQPPSIVKNRFFDRLVISPPGLEPSALRIPSRLQWTDRRDYNAASLHVGELPASQRIAIGKSWT